MKALIFSVGLMTTWALFASCSNQEFAGDSASAGTYKKGKPGKPNTSNNPNGDATKPNGNGLNTDDGGKVELVDAELTIDRLGDSAAWTNCLSAELVGGGQNVHLGCNKGVIPTNVKMKLLTNTCNTLRLTLTTNGSQNFTTQSANLISSGNASKHNSGINGKGMHIIPNAADGSFTVETNDNTDTKWHDTYLRIKPPANRPNIKFTIENSGIPCK
jgi:hypothetical protein